MSGNSAILRLVGAASDHHGFVTPATAADAGVDPARLPVMFARGQLERTARGLYRIPQLPAGRHDDFAGAAIRVGHGAVVSHESALFLHGVSDSRPETIDVTVPTSARVRRAALDGIKIWRDDLATADLTAVEGIPTTTMARALADCIGTGSIVTGSIGTGSDSAGPTAPSAKRPAGNSRTIQHSRVEVVDGKVFYDGRSLLTWASRIAERIVEQCNATRVILYGSVARGDDGPDSDIDLLVVMPIIGRRHDASVRVLNELRDVPVPIDINVIDPAHLTDEARMPGVVRVAMREGRVLVSV